MSEERRRDSDRKNIERHIQKTETKTDTTIIVKLDDVVDIARVREVVNLNAVSRHKRQGCMYMYQHEQQ